ncbi:MAG: hypothetical protein DHS20C15_34320 [Planctomycetota bacterium]|nr:MAG: hypothetical protein DHS20C15_34320 [Planctomycetota bacterium]
MVWQGDAPRSDDRRLVAREDLLDLPVFRETPAREFREDQFAVLLHFEGAAVARNQEQGFDGALVLLEQLFRQTDGSGLIVSNGAVGDLELHGVGRLPELTE